MLRRVMMISTHGYVDAYPELGKPDTGGQVVHLLELSKSLARLGFEVDILTRQFDGRALVEAVAPRVRLLRYPCGGDKFITKELLAEHVPEWCDRVLESSQISGRNYEFVNTHYWDAGVAGEILSSALSIPHLHTPHSLGVLKQANEASDADPASTAGVLSSRIPRERILYHRSDRIIATTSEQFDCLLDSDDYNVPAEKIDQIPPGYDDSLFFPDSGVCQLLRKELDPDARLLFAAGRIAKNKGYDLLIRALPEVIRRVPSARLLLAIGSAHPTPSEREILRDLEQLARDLNVEDRVVITNCVTQNRLAHLYRTADVFVLCSRYEPFGMTAIEAMACGTPTVVTTHGGLWEELTWGLDCLYCDPYDTEALSHTICSILLHPKVRRQLESHGPQTVKSRYTWKHVAKRLWASYVQHSGQSTRAGVWSCSDAR